MDKISVLVTGDFCPVQRLETLSEADVPQVLPEAFRTLIKSVDVAATNLECPITQVEQPISKTGPALKGSSKALDFLAEAKFQLVTLANNHIMDYGAKGLEDTLGALQDKAISSVGAGKNLEDASDIYLYNSKGKTLAIINVAENEWSTTHGEYPGANPIDPIHVYQQIKAAQQQADFILVITHGGHEMYELPSPRMQSWFRAFIDMGADAVVNHHTHCISGYEVYRDKPIFYSLGNFLFDKDKQRNGIWNIGVALYLEFSSDTINFHPYYFNQCQEIPTLEMIPREQVIDKINRLNLAIADSEILHSKFRDYCSSKKRMYSAYLEPHNNRWIVAMQNRGFLPSTWSKRKRLLLENLIRCEAHRDVVQHLLSNANSDT
ncbi:MAG: CapA family protein [Phaeodactylibacter sp.]|uniref:CapA family protein n=1 Tax=Phaeodactylibacter sp. TaxID=1940289 RepID=UPI0032ED4642